MSNLWPLRWTQARASHAIGGSATELSATDAGQEPLSMISPVYAVCSENALENPLITTKPDGQAE